MTTGGDRGNAPERSEGAPGRIAALCAEARNLRPNPELDGLMAPDGRSAWLACWQAVRGLCLELAAALEGSPASNAGHAGAAPLLTTEQAYRLTLETIADEEACGGDCRTLAALVLHAAGADEAPAPERSGEGDVASNAGHAGATDWGAVGNHLASALIGMAGAKFPKADVSQDEAREWFYRHSDEMDGIGSWVIAYDVWIGWRACWEWAQSTVAPAPPVAGGDPDVTAQARAIVEAFEERFKFVSSLGRDDLIARIAAALQAERERGHAARSGDAGAQSEALVPYPCADDDTCRYEESLPTVLHPAFGESPASYHDLAHLYADLLVAFREVNEERQRLLLAQMDQAPAPSPEGEGDLKGGVARETREAGSPRVERGDEAEERR